MLIGENSIVTAKTKPKLAILDPNTFDIAKSGDPFNADFILTISSGADVAKDTTVIPIKSLGIPNFKEIDTADFNNRFPPIIKTIKPKNNNEIVLKSIYLFYKDNMKCILNK